MGIGGKLSAGLLGASAVIGFATGAALTKGYQIVKEKVTSEDGLKVPVIGGSVILHKFGAEQMPDTTGFKDHSFSVFGKQVHVMTRSTQTDAPEDSADKSRVHVIDGDKPCVIWVNGIKDADVVELKRYIQERVTAEHHTYAEYDRSVCLKTGEESICGNLLIIDTVSGDTDNGGLLGVWQYLLSDEAKNHVVLVLSQAEPEDLLAKQYDLSEEQIQALTDRMVCHVVAVSRIHSDGTQSPETLYDIERIDQNNERVYETWKNLGVLEYTVLNTANTWFYRWRAEGVET